MIYWPTGCWGGLGWLQEVSSGLTGKDIRWPGASRAATCDSSRNMAEGWAGFLEIMWGDTPEGSKARAFLLERDTVLLTTLILRIFLQFPVLGSRKGKMKEKEISCPQYFSVVELMPLSCPPKSNIKADYSVSREVGCDSTHSFPIVQTRIIAQKLY